jgi:dethiobiotin synthetase/adenosylmethionine--8-amino-7-oxononanoate aminotransferase
MLWRDLKLLQIYGANTNVGKTIVSTVLCNAFQRRAPQGGTLYLKPVSTGPLEEADDRYAAYLDGKSRPPAKHLHHQAYHQIY